MRDGSVPLRGLMYFLAVVRTGSAVAAAAELGVTPSAVSHQIAALETWIGTPLLDRTRRPPRLTAAGGVLRDGTAPGMAGIAQMIAAVRDAASPGRLVVSAPPAFAALRLPAAIEALRLRRPGVEVDIRTTSFDAEVEPEVVHLAVRFRHTADEGHRLGEPRWSAVCAPSLHKRPGHPLHVSDLRGTTLAHEKVYNFWPEMLDRQSGPFLRLDGVLAVVGAALSGSAVGLAPRAVTRPLRDAGTLVALMGGNAEPEAAFYAIVTPLGEAKPRVADLLQEMRETAD